MITRFPMAVAASSTIILAAVIGGLWVGAVLDGQEVGAASEAIVGHLSFFVLFFGLPLCVSLTALFGGLLLAAERRRARKFPWLVRYAVPAALVAVALPVVWRLFWGRPFEIGLWLVVGAIAGWFAGVAFWRIVDQRSETTFAE